MFSKMLTEGLEEAAEAGDGKRIQSADGIKVGDTVRVSDKAKFSPIRGHVGKVKMIQAAVDAGYTGAKGKGHLAWVDFIGSGENRKAAGSHVNTLDLTVEKPGEIVVAKG